MVNEWTRDDLPDASVATDKYGAIGSMYFPAVDDYRDSVVEHMNANGGVPASREDAALADRLERQAATISELQGCFLRVERDAARWRRAHSIVEAERDQARRERDEWRTRAEAAERERDEALEACALFQQDAHKWRTKAEAAPAVTRAQVEVAIKWPLEGSNITLPEDLFQEQVDEVCRLLSIETVPDPVEALRAVLDVCEGLEEAHRANPTQMYEYGMEEAAHQVRNAIATALGEA